MEEREREELRRRLLDAAEAAEREADRARGTPRRRAALLRKALTFRRAAEGLAATGLLP